MMPKKFFFVTLMVLVSGVSYAQNFNLEYEYPAGYLQYDDYGSLDLKDLNGDGIPEIVIRDVAEFPSSSKIIILDNNYTEIWSYSSSSEVYFEGFADMDGNGDREMLISYYDYVSSKYVVVVVGVPNGEIMGTMQYDVFISVYDFDQDGKMEIAVREEPNTLQIWGLGSLSSVEGVVNSLPSVVLDQNYPNPFNPITTIRYQVQTQVNVHIDIVNLRGQVVRTLVNEVQPTGDYEVVWDGTDGQGRHQGSGSYIYVLHVGEFTASRKLIMLK